MTSSWVRIWVYERDYSEPDSYGEWQMTREYTSPVVPRIGETISNNPGFRRVGFRRVIGVDYLFSSEETGRSPIVALYVTRAEKRGLVEQ